MHKIYNTRLVYNPLKKFKIEHNIHSNEILIQKGNLKKS